MKVHIAAIFGTSVLVALILGFFGGRWWGILKADSGEQERYVLTDDMVILNSEGRPAGSMPKGTKLYFLPDSPFVDDPRMFFKAYFDVLTAHTALLREDVARVQYPRESYGLVPKQTPGKIPDRHSAKP